MEMIIFNSQNSENVNKKQVEMASMVHKTRVSNIWPEGHRRATAGSDPGHSVTLERVKTIFETLKGMFQSK